VTWLDALLGALAVYRATRLVTEDTIWEGTRDRVVAWSERDGRAATLRVKVGDLITCPWCASMWVAGLAVGSWWVLPVAVWRSGAAVLAASAVAGLVAAWEQR
jgi:hypothetical protein